MTINVKSPDDPGWLDALIESVQVAKLALVALGHADPFVLYANPWWDQHLDDDHSPVKGLPVTTTNRQHLQRTCKVQVVRTPGGLRPGQPMELCGI